MKTTRKLTSCSLEERLDMLCAVLVRCFKVRELLVEILNLGLDAICLFALSLRHIVDRGEYKPEPRQCRGVVARSSVIHLANAIIYRRVCRQRS